MGGDFLSLINFFILISFLKKLVEIVCFKKIKKKLKLIIFFFFSIKI